MNVQGRNIYKTVGDIIASDNERFCSNKHRFMDWNLKPILNLMIPFTFVQMTSNMISISEISGQTANVLIWPNIYSCRLNEVAYLQPKPELIHKSYLVTGIANNPNGSADHLFRHVPLVELRREDQYESDTKDPMDNGHDLDNTEIELP